MLDRVVFTTVASAPRKGAILVLAAKIVGATKTAISFVAIIGNVP